MSFRGGGYRMFNVKKPVYINKTIRLPLELVEKLTVLAQEKQISLNNLIVQCCEYALGSIDNEEDHTYLKMRKKN